MSLSWTPQLYWHLLGPPSGEKSFSTEVTLKWSVRNTKEGQPNMGSNREPDAPEQAERMTTEGLNAKVAMSA
jgi:hypothetical protein